MYTSLLTATTQKNVETLEICTDVKITILGFAETLFIDPRRPFILLPELKFAVGMC